MSDYRETYSRVLSALIAEAEFHLEKLKAELARVNGDEKKEKPPGACL